MSIAEPLTVLKAELMHQLVPQVVELLATALQEGTAVHHVERGLWEVALQLGRRSLAAPGRRSLADTGPTPGRRSPAADPDRRNRPSGPRRGLPDVPRTPFAADGLEICCATKKGFEQPGFAFGCPIGEEKVGSMGDLVRAKTASEEAPSQNNRRIVHQVSPSCGVGRGVLAFVSAAIRARSW